MLDIREAIDSDRDAIWQIFHEVIATGETYPLDPNISREDATAYWFQRRGHAYVADNDGEVVGSYALHANQSGGGAHVANAAFIVAESGRGQGTGRTDGRALLEGSAPSRFPRNAIQLRRFNQRRRGKTLAGPRDEDRRDVARCVSASDEGICRCLCDVSIACVATALRAVDVAQRRGYKFSFEFSFVSPICLT